MKTLIPLLFSCLSLIISQTVRAESLTFIAVGDTGTGKSGQYRVAEAIASVCASRDCQFAIGLGDNIYENGAESSDDSEFIDKFEMPYIDLDFPFYMALGNHDNSHFDTGDGLNNFKGDFQVDYHYRDDRISDKWKMPARYYHFAMPENSEQPLADFLALDSNPIAGGLDWDYKFWRSRYTKEHRRWIRDTLKASKGQWKIAFSHHPYVSNGRHGNAGIYDGLAGQGKTWKKLTEDKLCGKIDLLITGHDHDLQWLAPKSGCDKTSFIVSGAGAKTRGLTNPHRNEAWYQAGDVLGFFVITLNQETLTGEAFVVNPDTGEATKTFTKTLTKQS
ncbi:metallophosphoesterase [Parendozoicomonas haliclonae]|uniref:Calcineurin-like phosphoesterase n=1 Tax=Parendozoicomonas haliclonae TaxID=1960125 RepID=A0A1X7AME7_9GAMM|nr:metallophosphoesterase [Parendozoicomonas haliclonae]SMA49408.1 Calcineurin-like phosphoesterase [Parendozoicomonas haliclonae]